MDYFGDNIQAFILQAFKEDTPLFKFLEENTINMVFSNNKLHCNKDDFIKVYNMLFGPGHVWPSISRNFNYHRMKISSFSYCDRSIIITFPDDFSLDKPFRRSPKKIHYHCEVPGCGYTAKQKISVKIHMLSHNCKGHYKCEVPGCGYSTNETNRIKTHIRAHKNERPKLAKIIPPPLPIQPLLPVQHLLPVQPPLPVQPLLPIQPEDVIDVDDQSTVIDVDDQSTVVDVDDLIMLTS
jgi:hypothetical protein